MPSPPQNLANANLHTDQDLAMPPQHGQSPDPALAAARQDLLERTKTADTGSAELDARLDCFLNSRRFVTMATGTGYWWQETAGASARFATPAARWSQDALALLELIPADHDFSLGRRDGVVWAWLQPHDAWRPAANQPRHDHPLGSGLVVASTVPLVMAAALVAWRRGC